MVRNFKRMKDLNYMENLKLNIFSENKCIENYKNCIKNYKIIKNSVHLFS